MAWVLMLKMLKQGMAKVHLGSYIHRKAKVRYGGRFKLGLALLYRYYPLTSENIWAHSLMLFVVVVYFYFYYILEKC